MSPPPIRSSLYVPGNRPDRFDKALASGADSIILDLEDAVALPDKANARAAIASWLEANPGVPAWIRVNNAEGLRADDLALAESVPCHGIVMAKAEPSACAATELATVALIESAEGVATLDAIAALPNVTRLALGEADLAADLGMQPSDDGAEFASIRSAVVVATARHGLVPAAGPVPTDLDDVALLARTSAQLRRQGFGGRSIIHPNQVTTVHTAFTSSADDVAWAEQVLESAAGGPTAVVDGAFVDAAVLRRAHHILRNAGAT